MEELEIKTKYIVEKILDEIGVKVSVKGYKFWITATILKLKNEDESMGELYANVAKKHKTTAYKAERALRYAYEDIRPRVVEYFDLKYKVNNSILLECLTRKAKLFVKRNKLSNRRRYLI